MLRLHRDHASQLPSLLAISMTEQEVHLDFFNEDVELGIGDARVSEAWTKDQAAIDQPGGFAQHLEALARVSDEAMTAKLRFKLNRNLFCQLSFETLGTAAGCGVVQISPNRMAILPLTLKDVGRFLATAVFIQEHLGSRPSQGRQTKTGLGSEIAA